MSDNRGKAAVSPRMSAGLAGRVEAMERTASTSSDVSGEQKDAAAAVAAGASTPRPTPGTISPGLASRMKSMNLGSDATGDGGKATAHSAGGTNALSAPPASESSISSPAVTTKMSPGLAARMGKAVPIPMPGGESEIFHSSHASWVRSAANLVFGLLQSQRLFFKHTGFIKAHSLGMLLLNEGCNVGFLLA